MVGQKEKENTKESRRESSGHGPMERATMEKAKARTRAKEALGTTRELKAWMHQTASLSTCRRRRTRRATMANPRPL